MPLLCCLQGLLQEVDALHIMVVLLSWPLADSSSRALCVNTEWLLCGFGAQQSSHCHVALHAEFDTHFKLWN